MQVFCTIKNQYEGFRELEKFNAAASVYWSKTGQIFPMYDIETAEIFECAFNAETGIIVAYATVSIEQFREKLEEIAQKLIQENVQKAIAEASEKASKIYSNIAYIEKLYLLR